MFRALEVWLLITFTGLMPVQVCLTIYFPGESDIHNILHLLPETMMPYDLHYVCT